MCQAARCKLVATLLCTWRPREQLDHKSRTKCFASLPSEWNCTGTVTVGYQSIHRHELDPVLVRLGPPLLLPIHPTGHVSESFFSQRGKHIPRTRDHSDRQQNWIKIDPTSTVLYRWAFGCFSSQQHRSNKMMKKIKSVKSSKTECGF